MPGRCLYTTEPAGDPALGSSCRGLGREAVEVPGLFNGGRLMRGGRQTRLLLPAAAPNMELAIDRTGESLAPTSTSGTWPLDPAAVPPITSLKTNIREVESSATDKRNGSQPAARNGQAAALGKNTETAAPGHPKKDSG